MDGKLSGKKNKHQLYLASDTLKIKNIYENTEGIQANLIQLTQQTFEDPCN